MRSNRSPRAAMPSSLLTVATLGSATGCRLLCPHIGMCVRAASGYERASGLFVSADHEVADGHEPEGCHHLERWGVPGGLDQGYATSLPGYCADNLQAG